MVMNRAAILFAVLFSHSAWAQHQLYSFPCSRPPEPDYAKCLRDARTQADRTQCALMLQHDIREVDDWQRCMLAEVDAEAAKKKEAVNDQAAQRRNALLQRLGTNSMR